jgi:hypothetical protein
MPRAPNVQTIDRHVLTKASRIVIGMGSIWIRLKLQRPSHSHEILQAGRVEHITLNEGGEGSALLGDLKAHS